MIRFVCFRLLQAPLILGLVFTATILLSWVMPGSPVADSDRITSAAIEEAMLRQYNLDSPWNFGRSYLKGLIHGGDGWPAPYLGPSLQSRDFTVNELLTDRLPVSMVLGLAALVLAIVIGVGAGVMGAIRPGSWAGAMSSAVAVIGVSIPAFVIGSLLLALAGWMIGWVPLRGWEWPTGAPFHAAWWRGMGHVVTQMSLPALTLALGPGAYIARLVRLGLMETLGSDFIRTARAKGVGPFRVLVVHALKPACLPVLSFIGPAAAVVLTGSFVVEAVFAINGVGRLFVEAVLTKDMFVLIGVVLVYSSLVVVLNLLTDVAYALVDPRITLT